MKKMFFYRLTMSAALWCAALISSVAVAQQLTVTETVFDRAANEENFAFGADISWLSQQESWNTYYCNRKGQRAELMSILKGDFGLNAVRFRVWVNPSGGWSGKQDVINLCKRAKAKGFKIMISFHYSDTWADSGSQTIPGQWTDHSVEALAQNVYDHTYDVLKSLYDLDIHPRWVAIGNETKYGMLYDVGKTKSTTGYQNFARFINSGYKAVKDVDPSMLTVIHLPNGHDLKTAQNMFDQLQKYGAKYDVIGFSAYPRWSHLDVSTDAAIKSTIDTYLSTFNAMKTRFGKPVMVVETGHYVDRPLEGNRFLAEFMKALIADGELGCFFWEPEAMDNSGYNLGAWSSQTHQATIAMDAYLGWKHTVVDSYGKVSILAPIDTVCNDAKEGVELKVEAETATKATSVNKVEFYLDGLLWSNQAGKTDGKDYSYMTGQLSTGGHQFYAKMYDSQNHIVVSDTISFLVGEMRVFQEGDEGYVGCENMEDTLSVRKKPYTGKGYIPASDDRTSAVNWQAYFPEAGEYVFVFRYRTDVTRSTKLAIDGTSKYMTCYVSCPGKWCYVTKKMNVDEPGMHAIQLIASTKGLPDVDFMAIASPEGAALVTYRNDDATGIESVNEMSGADADASLNIYDLSGRIVSSDGRTDGLKRGIYLCGGKKVVLSL